MIRSRAGILRLAARPARECSGGRARPRRPSRRRRARRGSGRRGRADLIDASAPSSGPGIAAIRASNCRSRMKFWPSALLALKPVPGDDVAQRLGRVAQADVGADGRRIRAAIRIAAAIGRGSARSCPAMSNAVPWSGAVRTIGRPSVMLTPPRNAAPSAGSAPGRDTCTAPRRSWRAPRRGTWCRRGGGRSPASLPRAAPRSPASMISISSRPSVPPSPAWGLRPATASRGSAIPKLRCSPRSAARPRASISAADQRAGDLGRAADGW